MVTVEVAKRDKYVSLGLPPTRVSTIQETEAFLARDISSNLATLSNNGRGP
jgi:hypothetical protein